MKGFSKALVDWILKNDLHGEQITKALETPKRTINDWLHGKHLPHADREKTIRERMRKYRK
jgi:hypothetical protein